MAYKEIKNVKNDVLKNGVHLLTSDYKTRNKKRPNHNGMDMIGKKSSLDYIVSDDDGVVLNVSYDSISGYYVFIKHLSNLKSFYCHMKKGSIKVKKGQYVKKGDVIGYMGATGTVSGAHLHYGVRTVNNVHQDPLPYLQGTKTFTEYTKGTYEVLNPRYVRTGPGTEYPIKKVKDLTADGQKNATSKKPNANAQYKKDTRFTARTIELAKSGSIWAKTPSGYVCIESAKDVQYCKEVK